VDGPLNMALDEIMWHEAAGGRALLRIYGWADRPAVSFGYFQSLDEVRAVPGWSELPLVRRLTGGGAIVHDSDLTFSLALPAQLAPGTAELYNRVHRTIAAALTNLSAPAQVGDASTGNVADPACFRRSDRFAVRVFGHKVVGSAQRRQTDSVLMHGSLVLARSVAAPEIRGLEELTGVRFDRSQLVVTLARAISDAVAADLQQAALPSPLLQRAERLADEKYRSQRWTELRERKREAARPAAVGTEPGPVNA